MGEVHWLIEVVVDATALSAMRCVPCAACRALRAVRLHVIAAWHQGNKNLSFFILIQKKYSPWIIYCI